MFQSNYKDIIWYGIVIIVFGTIIKDNYDSYVQSKKK